MYAESLGWSMPWADPWQLWFLVTTWTVVLVIYSTWMHVGTQDIQCLYQCFPGINVTSWWCIWGFVKSCKHFSVVHIRHEHWLKKSVHAIVHIRHKHWLKKSVHAIVHIRHEHWLKKSVHAIVHIRHEHWLKKSVHAVVHIRHEHWLKKSVHAILSLCSTMIWWRNVASSSTTRWRSLLWSQSWIWRRTKPSKKHICKSTRWDRVIVLMTMSLTLYVKVLQFWTVYPNVILHT